MPNESNESEQKIVTKKHIARIEKEQKQRKILLIGIFSIVAIIILLVVYGVLSKTVFITGKFAAGRTVATVNSEKITVDQFQKRVRFERLTLEQTFLNYQLSQYSQYFQTQLLDVQNKMDAYVDFGETVLDKMISEKIVTQKAKELGLTVSEDEITKALQENFGFYANGTPSPTATFEYKPTSTFSPTQLAIVTLTPIPTTLPTETLMPTETSTPEFTPLPTDSTVMPTATIELPTSTPTLSDTPTEIPPTPTDYTLSGYNNLYSTVVANLSSQTQFGDVDFRDYVRDILYRQKLYDYVTKDVSTEQDMVWARHILVATEADAETVLSKLKSGEDFASVAAYYSTDTANSGSGGDLGWMYKGQMVQEFEDAAWKMNVGEISQPIKTSFGYHIIQVLGHEKRQLTADELNSAKSTAYQKYVDQITAAAKTKKYNLWASVVPSDPSIPTEYRISATPQAQ